MGIFAILSDSFGFPPELEPGATTYMEEFSARITFLKKKDRLPSAILSSWLCSGRFGVQAKRWGLGVRKRLLFVCHPANSCNYLENEGL